MRTILIVAVTASLLFSIATQAQENWSRFRGTDGTRIVQDHPALPEVSGKEKNVQWVMDIPGLGWSSPIVWGDRVFLTSSYSDKEQAKYKEGYLDKTKPKRIFHWMVYCLNNETGKILWSHEAHKGPAEARSVRRRSNSYASATPATDGEQLYVLFGEHGLYCYDFDGKPLWTYPIDPKETFFNYGHAASPITHNGRVIFTYDNEEQSFIALLDGKTGKLIWKVDRDEPTTWATPLIWTNGIRTEIVTSGKNRIRSYDLDGKLLWYMDGGMTDNLVPPPFSGQGMVYLASGYYKYRHRPVYAIKPGASGDISLQSWNDGTEWDRNAPRSGTEAEVEKMGGDITRDTPDEEHLKNDFIEWYQPVAAPEVTSPIVYGDYYYTLLDRGYLTCHDARTGREVYGRVRLVSRFMSSPWAYNNRLFCLSEKGKTYVIKPGPTFETLNENDLNEVCLSTPAIAQGKLIIRTESKVYCMTEGKNNKRRNR